MRTYRKTACVRNEINVWNTNEDPYLLVFWQGCISRPETTKDWICQHLSSRSIWIPVSRVWWEDEGTIKQSTGWHGRRGEHHWPVNQIVPTQARKIETIPWINGTGNYKRYVHQAVFRSHQEIQLYQQRRLKMESKTTQSIDHRPLLVILQRGSQETTIRTPPRRWVGKQCHTTRDSPTDGNDNKWTWVIHY